MRSYFSKLEIFKTVIEQIRYGDDDEALADDLYTLFINGYFNNKNFVKLFFLMNKIRKLLGTPVILTSTLRLGSYNAKLKGSSKNSGHLTFQAFDFTIKGDLNDAYEKIKEYVDELGITELILYPRRKFIHVGIKKRDEVYIAKEN